MKREVDLDACVMCAVGVRVSFVSRPSPPLLSSLLRCPSVRPLPSPPLASPRLAFGTHTRAYSEYIHALIP
jgi:hypothetical protein